MSPTPLTVKSVGTKFDQLSSLLSILFFVNDLFLSGELPNDLRYLEPEPLLKIEGLSWQFQKSDELMSTFKDALLNHYENFISERGKSRIATELLQLAKDCAVNHSELQERLKSALVFNISFENGTALDINDEKDPDIAIGTRMLFQLLPNWHGNWNEFKKSYKIGSVKILEGVAKNLGKKLEDLAIFITVDGMQAIETRDGDGLNKTSLLYSYLITISNLVQSQSGLFIIDTCTATTHHPIEQYLASSTQKRGFLPTVSLSPPTYLINKIPQKVFPDHPIIDILVNDMGGHGHALEVLQNSLHNRDIDNYNFLDLMNNIHTQLEDRYNYWLTKANEFKPLLCVILAHQIIELDHPIPGTKFFPEDYTHLGLVKFERLVDILKSEIFDNNEWITLEKLYNGARHSFGDTGIHNQHLHQWQNVQCENNIIEINDYYKYCIINAPNAPAGSVNQKNYVKEHEKTAADDNVFILYTCGESKDDLPKMDTPNLNTATTTQLTGMKGIGNEYAQRILGKCPFRDLDDCESRTKIPRTLLEQFQLKSSFISKLPF
ncbi:20731_t:CDS:2 [Entrophospora sp. SA101]|nr:20731_t:CDS:2 [Entrophospora sp. SA101]